MTLMLVTDRLVELYPPGELDEHGWREPGAGPPAWCGPGNFQLAPPLADARAAIGGGRGPHDPAANPTGTLYLGPEAPVAEGWTARLRGRAFTLSAVRLVVDPTGGALDCYAATATALEEVA